MSGPGAQALAEALARHHAGDRPRAILSYRRSLALEPKQPAAVLGLSMLFLEIGREADAEPLLANLVASHPEIGLPHCLLGQALLLLDRPLEAEPHLRRALEVDPALASAHVHLGHCLELRNAAEEGLVHYGLARLLEPAAPQIPTCQAGAYQRLGRYPEADASFREALALAPDDLATRYNHSILLLLQGRLEEGWPGRELRWQATGVAPREFEEPDWDGTTLAGRTILVHGAQEGLGDAIMALRYTRLLKEQGARVLVECAPSLANLFRTCPWPDEVIPEGAPLPPFHCQAHLMSLPWLFRTRLDTIPGGIPYLGVPASPLSPRQWRCAQRLETSRAFRIGLVFAGKPGHPEDARRSLPPEALAELAVLRPRATFYSLQQHRTPALPRLPKALGAVDLGDLLVDFTDTARAVAAMDLVISVDTSVAHLAGAMGKPVQLLLPHRAEWRWMLDRADSPWYPTFRLYRQDQPGDWAPVLQRLAREALP